MSFLFIIAVFGMFILAKSSLYHTCMKLFTNGTVPLSVGFYQRRVLPKLIYYDHSSCFLMKARYNCMDSRLSASNNSIFDWEFVLKGENEINCHLNHLFEATGGLKNLAKNIRSWSHRRENVTHTNVLIVGNSFVRQVFEAITCRYRDHIVRGLVQFNATSMSLSNINATYGIADMGDIVSMNDYRAGCHGPIAEHYYEPQFTPLQINSECGDSMSMVELDEGLRFYYVFRHFNFDKDLPVLFDKLNLKISDIDVVVTNNKLSENLKLFTMLHPHVPKLDFNVLSVFKTIQTRDCGWWDGAHNIGLVMAADVHPCMPGIPDDEADLLLFMLAKKILKHVTK